MFAQSTRNLVPRSLFLLVALALVASGCASTGAGYHRHVMRGLVVGVVDQDVSICIGTRDGAKVGQELEVYRIVKQASGPKGPPSYDREKTGVVRIEEIFNEHFARASVVSGEVKEGSVAELEVK